MRVRILKCSNITKQNNALHCDMYDYLIIHDDLSEKNVKQVTVSISAANPLSITTYIVSTHRKSLSYNLYFEV